MKEAILPIVFILLVGLCALVSADELSDRIIMGDIVMWKLIDSDTASGIGEDMYVGTYEAQNPRAQSGFTRFFVKVIMPKQETAEDLFNKKKGTLGGRESRVTKIVKQDNHYVNIVWFSGEYLIQIGPGTLEETASNYIGGIEALGEAYMDKYPSDAELKEQCEEIGLRRETTYCYDTGVYLDQKPDGDSCLNDFECKSNNCKNSACAPFCSGCFDERDNCLTYGTRTETSFCNIDGKWAIQKATGKGCNNDYECETNLCIDDECIKPGLFQAIIRWFKTLFS